MSVGHVLGAHRGQKRALGPLELELWPVMNHHVDAGKGAQVFRKKSKCSQILSHLSRPLFSTFRVWQEGQEGQEGQETKGSGLPGLHRDFEILSPKEQNREKTLHHSHKVQPVLTGMAALLHLLWGGTSKKPSRSLGVGIQPSKEMLTSSGSKARQRTVFLWS